ncbi:hypothetical protein HNQ75_003612 [Rhizobium flavum]|uniref:Uncharacterized protein n=1 Tax=Pseudorhizobium flavum TaxID=1335061 RepID=A0A7X0DFX6_9HYPH|nr:hypothetical protein [Pseudorhizobium flavum]CAD6619498.1 hypothetical protein RFYW14_03840 [Pseudorhizobium flavum]
MTRRVSMLFAAMAILTATGRAAAITAAPSTQLKVGRTEIHCYKNPCPWNGVWPASRAAHPNNLLWSGPTPPPMTGNAADLARVRSDYLEGCTLVEARFSGRVIAVERIIGKC